MKLHRLALRNYRGVEDREICFADRGVTVVSGANEIGKSSLFEALDLLLEYKDRSAHKQVKQVKPTHADVGAEVEAEISTGVYRFVYRKRFHKNRETALSILAPVREQLAGDEAHDRVQAMLAETVDTALWQAQRVLQADSTTPVELSDCDALSRALDIAAGRGDQDAADDANPVLIEQIEAEYRKYFTATGRETGEWAEARAALREAKAHEAACLTAVEEVDERLRRHTELGEQIAALDSGRAAVEQRLTAATTAAERVAAISADLEVAEAAAKDTATTAAGAARALADRLELQAELTRRGTAVAEAQAAAHTADALIEAARIAAETADADAAAAEAARIAATAAAEAARSVVERLRQRVEADRLAERLARIAAAETEFAAVEAELATITVTDAGWRAIQRADAEVHIAQAKAELAATVLELTAESDTELLADQAVLPLSTGATRTLTLTEATELRLPGVLRARIVPAASAAEGQSTLMAARARLTALLEPAGCADVAAAEALDGHRRELSTRRDGLTAVLAGLLAGEEITDLRRRSAELAADLDADPELGDADLDTARAAVAAATAAQAAADRDGDTARAAAAQCAAARAQCELRAATGRERLDAARTELDAVTRRLAEARAATADDRLTAAAATAQSAAERADQRVAELGLRYAEADAEAVATELRGATESSVALAARHEELTREQRDAAVALEVFGGEGRTSKLQAAQTAVSRAGTVHDRVRDRARAAATLRSVIGRHRENTRRRYVEPFRAEIQRLGRGVFGATFEVEVDSDLRIRSRTLDGRTVPYDSLSGGAKEQLGIIARLAVAALVAHDDTVPVVIDDALGFTDPDRLARMAEVFDLAGADGQVIVLTCAPERFDAIADAHRIDLGDGAPGPVVHEVGPAA